MDIGRLIKWLIVAAILFFVWKAVLPWVKKEMGSSTSTSSGVKQSPCVAAASRASEAWGSGLGRFVNPPYDLAAWSSFRGDVDAQINAADATCNCADASCQRVRGALGDLRTLVSQFDTAIRNGTAPPEDAVRQQESIDNRINEPAD